jgi:hypothetical protein
MFGFLQQWKNRRRNRQRLLFAFWDGFQFRRVDPFRVWRDIQSDKTVDLESMSPLVDDGKEPETTLVVDVIARAFDIQRWDSKAGKGLTDWEVLNLFGDLSTYLLDIKKKSNPGPTQLPPTAPLSSIATEAPAEGTKL